MKECTIVVKKVYETKRSRTITEKEITLSVEALIDLSMLVSKRVFWDGESSLKDLFYALQED